MWDLCDKAFSRDLPGAMRSLRTLLEAGEAGLMLLGAITSRLRDLIRVKSLPERLAPAEAARQAGLRFDWQVRRYREQAKRFSPDELAGLHERITWADRALKSGRPTTSSSRCWSRRSRGSRRRCRSRGVTEEAAARFAALASRDLRRAAVRLWSMPLEAALS